MRRLSSSEVWNMDNGYFYTWYSLTFFFFFFALVFDSLLLCCRHSLFFVCLSLCLFCLSACVFACLSACLSIGLSVCVSVCASCLSPFLSVRMFCVLLSVGLSPLLSIRRVLTFFVVMQWMTWRASRRLDFRAGGV